MTHTLLYAQLEWFYEIWDITQVLDNNSKRVTRC